MQPLLLIILILVLAVCWLVVWGKVVRLEAEIEHLRKRIFRLESQPPTEQVIARQETASAGPAPAPEPLRVAQRLEHQHDITAREVKQVFVPSEPIPPISAPVPGFATRVRKRLGDKEWETVVGGSLLNKLGALVLVIGIALFLGYSFTHMSPPGRALTSLGGSFGLLIAGLVFEQKQTYRVFARGLIGAGWAALYVTAYAMYALPAARLISNPYFGSVLLVLVAVAMIAHSLRYRVQAATAVAYFSGFAALGVTPSSSFALLSLVPLGASLLYLAYRFEWNTMAVFGVVATYGACIWRGSSGASLLAAESLLLVYWFLFESFDLLRVRRRATGSGLEFIFPLNAIAFLGLSYRAWSVDDPARMWRAYACAAALTAALTALAIAVRAVGVWLSAGFAIEAEILYLAGVFLNLSFLRWLGGFGFFLSLGRLWINDVVGQQTIAVGGRTIHVWTPAALFHAMLFYINRLLKRPNAVFSSLAAALISMVLGQELPARFVGTAWLVFAVVLFELGLRKMLREFRFQAYFVAAGGVGIGISMHVLRMVAHPWIPLTCALVLVYALILRVVFGAPKLPEQERKRLEIAGAACLTTLSLLLVWHLAPEHYRGVSSCILAFILSELGALKLPAKLVPFSYVAMAVGSVVLIGEESSHFSKPALDYVWISYSGAAVCLYLLSERARRRSAVVRAFASSAAVVFTLCALWLVLPDPVVAPAWSAVALALFVLGLHRDLLHERWQAYLAMTASVLNAWIMDFHPIAAVVVCACYFAQFLSPAEGEQFPRGWLGYVEKYPRVFWSLLGTISLAALLWQQFPGGLLTTAWGIEGLTLLGVGFPVRERVLRLEGLSMLLVCILKLFLYDLRNLETLYRILSFVALGLILLAVSWIYTRFRERVSRYL